MTLPRFKVHLVGSVVFDIVRDFAGHDENEAGKHALSWFRRLSADEKEAFVVGRFDDPSLVVMVKSAEPVVDQMDLVQKTKDNRHE